MEQKYRKMYILVKVIFVAATVAAALIAFLIFDSDTESEALVILGAVLFIVAIILLIFSISAFIGYGVKTYVYKNYRISIVRGFFSDKLIINDEIVDSFKSPVGFSWLLPLETTLPSGEQVHVQVAPLWKGAFVKVDGKRI